MWVPQLDLVVVVVVVVATPLIITGPQGENVAAAFENIVKSSHLNVIKGMTNVVGSQMLLQSSLWNRLGTLAMFELVVRRGPKAKVFRRQSPVVVLLRDLPPMLRRRCPSGRHLEMRVPRCLHGTYGDRLVTSSRCIITLRLTVGPTRPIRRGHGPDGTGRPRNAEGAEKLSTLVHLRRHPQVKARVA